MTRIRADQRYELKYIVHHTQAAELATALAMTGADAAQSELGYTGAGVRVALAKRAKQAKGNLVSVNAVYVPGTAPRCSS